MSKPKQYSVQCGKHGDAINPIPLTHKQAKELVKTTKELQKLLPIGADCKLEIVEFRAPRMTFDSAFAAAAFGPMEGIKIARDGWNGKGLFVQAQYPDENSKMGNPYLYIDATALGGKRNPWVPSQTDLFADDWYIVEEA